ncbi:MAG: NADP-dependent oxidoreductase [Myxococcales bacterium]|nr:NADP-dependent oxidoreductase [Myxococcales bacterium]MCB9704819.1 NADP-dependent oxidoreductase [Myxococcales bacterium]
MRAVVVPRRGPPEVMKLIEDHPDPVIRRPDEVLVRVRATSVNPIDTYVRGGVLPMPLRRDHILGGDACGTVEAVGAGVRRFAVGDRVFGLRDYIKGQGCYAELALFREDELAAAPAGLSDEELASIPLVGLTAYQALVDLAGLQAGERVLIHGGSGGVGSFAIQLARALGADVSATASPANAELCRELGAAEVLDYKTHEYRRLQGLDVVFDTIGAYYLESMPLLRRGGRYVSTTVMGNDERVSLVNMLRHGMRMIGSALRAPFGGTRAGAVRVKPNGAELEKIAELLANGAIRPLVAVTLPLAEAAAAHRQSESKRTRGKIVLAIP